MPSAAPAACSRPRSARSSPCAASSFPTPPRSIAPSAWSRPTSRHEYSTADDLPMPAPAGAVNAIFAPLMSRRAAQLGSARLRRASDMRSRLVGRPALPPPGPRGDDAGMPADAARRRRACAARRRFRGLYERKFGRGSAYREAGIEMTMFRLTATRPDAATGLPRGGRGRRRSRRPPRSGGARSSSKRTDALVEADIYDFTRTRARQPASGPAVIHTPITTIAVQRGRARAWTATATSSSKSEG